MLNRYVLDANVLVSAVLSPGSTANLIEYVNQQQ